MKIVCDTNVLISAILFGGRPQEVLRKVIEGKATGYISPVLRCELAEVLGRKKFGLTPQKIAAILRLISETFIEVFPSEVPDIIADDPDDNHVLACAMEAHAGHIVTGDVHLLSLGEHENIKILSPDAFLQDIK